jgi:hypothetical protein
MLPTHWTRGSLLLRKVVTCPLAACCFLACASACKVCAAAHTSCCCCCCWCCAAGQSKFSPVDLNTSSLKMYWGVAKQFGGQELWRELLQVSTTQPASHNSSSSSSCTSSSVHCTANVLQNAAAPAGAEGSCGAFMCMPAEVLPFMEACQPICRSAGCICLLCAAACTLGSC